MARALTIGYDATAAVRQRAGIGRYAHELLAALASLPTPDEYRLVWSAAGATVPLPALNARFHRRPIPASDRVMNIIWQRIRLPIPVELRTGRLDLMHSPDFSLPPSVAPGIVTIHDLAFERVPECSVPSLRDYLRSTVPRVIKRAGAVIAVSQATKRDIEELYGTDEAKIWVIPEAASSAFRPLPAGETAHVRSRYGLERPFIVAVSTLEPRKNYERLLDAFAALKSRGRPHDLVIVGRLGWMYDGIFTRRAELDLCESVRILSDVGDADLAALYNLAAVAVYPSLYEGFGIPALEAMACGCPLACSNVSSLPEIVDDSAVTFDPRSVEDIVEVLDALLSDDAGRDELSRRGLLRARAFSWSRAAEETRALYEHVAHG